MKKNMIALAVAGALVAPVAMAEVTISGGLQAELVQIGGKDNSPNGLYAADAWQAESNTGENGGNYGFLKFSATEDLGGGMKALAVYNLNANVGDSSDNGSPAGAAGLATRESYVGLSTGVGTVLAGTVTSPYAQNRTIDPFLGTSFQARGNGGMIAALHNGYISNTLAYANSFAGGMVKLVAGIVLDEANKGSGDKTNGKNAFSFAVDIAPMAGLTATIAYVDISKMGSCSTSSTSVVNTSDAGSATDPVVTTTTTTCAQGADNRAATKLAAKYAASKFSVAAQLEMLDKGFSAQAEKFNVMYLTGTYNVDDTNSVSLSYGSIDKKAFSAANDNSEGYLAVGFKHAFSKNTSAMVGYRQTTDVGGADGVDEKAAGVGLRVAF